MSETILTASSLRRCVRGWTSGWTGTVLSSRGYGRVSAKLAGNPMSCIATCSSTCRWSSRAGQEAASGRKGDFASREAARSRRVQTSDVIKLVIHDNPDGKYLIKGGGPKIWKRFGLRKKDRRSQGLICGKRCGVTENVGLAARKRWREQQNSMDRKAA